MTTNSKQNKKPQSVSCSDSLKSIGVLGEKTYKLLRRIPIETIEIDTTNRVVLRLLRHIDKEDAQTLFSALEQTLKQDREIEKEEWKRF